MAIDDSTTAPQSGAGALSRAITPTSLSAEARHLTVGYVLSEKSHPPGKPLTFKRGGHPPERPPLLRVQGRWLDRAGFPIGTKVRVLVSPKRLIIEVVEKIPERSMHLPRHLGQTIFANYACYNPPRPLVVAAYFDSLRCSGPSAIVSHCIM